MQKQRFVAVKLSDVFTMLNTLLIAAWIAYFTFATKPSDVAAKLSVAAKEVSGTVQAVERAVRESNVDIARNAGDIKSLGVSVSAILSELSNLQVLLKGLYDSLLASIESRTEDRFKTQDARADWLEFQRLNAEKGIELNIPVRFSK